jgi:hypothetical protein
LTWRPGKSQREGLVFVVFLWLFPELPVNSSSLLMMRPKEVNFDETSSDEEDTGAAIHQARLEQKAFDEVCKNDMRENTPVVFLLHYITFHIVLDSALLRPRPSSRGLYTPCKDFHMLANTKHLKTKFRRNANGNKNQKKRPDPGSSLF